MMDSLTARAISHYNKMGDWPSGILQAKCDMHYRFTRISPASLRSNETPDVGGKTNISFGVWIIQPERGLFLRVELV